MKNLPIIALIFSVGSLLYSLMDRMEREIYNKIESLHELSEFNNYKPIIPSPDTWSVFIEALIFVESGGDDSAVGEHEDGGCLQITPVYIAEANGILGRKGFYKPEDRFDRQKSIEIFEVVNAFHNPEKSMGRACQLHNPRGGDRYVEKVMEKYNELINNL